MHRFFVPPEWIDHERVVITGSQARQLKDVLRLKIDDEITVLDNTGGEYQIKLVDIKSKAVIGEIVQRCRCLGEPLVEIILYQAVLKGKRFDFVVQKCTEIGVVKIVPVFCKRCFAGKPNAARMDRWRQIMLEAAEQSGRGKIPDLCSAIDFKKACDNASGFSLLPWEEERSTGIRTALSNFGGAGRFNIFIGPEGGLALEEADYAQSKGIIPVSLGRLILRAETAGLVTAAAILYESGELGGSGVI
jgi:16S rRNA (uracil1498-N3)-methyltransferase